MSIENLKDLLEDELKDLYHAEGQILKALPKLVKTAQDEDLRAAFEGHLEETKAQKARLEECFELLGIAAKAKPCEGMKGIIQEGNELIEELEGAVTDAAIIAAAQKVEHYEIASYGCVRTWAQALGHEDVANLLQQTLDEEKEADVKLTVIATTCANRAAEECDDEGEDEDDETSSEMESEEEESAEPARAKGSAKKPTTDASRRRDRAAKR
jgi:ferritin-like metal-binding protein YciE